MCLSGVLNQDNGNVTSFKDGNCSVIFERVDSFVMLVNLEELNFGNSSSHCDLLLIRRNRKDRLDVAIFELKGIQEAISKKSIDELTNHLRAKYYSTLSLLGTKKLNNSGHNDKTNKLDYSFKDLFKNFKVGTEKYVIVVGGNLWSLFARIKLQVKTSMGKDCDCEFIKCGEKFHFE